MLCNLGRKDFVTACDFAEKNKLETNHFLSLLIQLC